MLKSLLLVLCTVGALLTPEHHEVRMPVEGSMGYIEHVYVWDENDIAHMYTKEEYYVFSETNIRLEKEVVKSLYGETDQAPACWLNAGL